MSMGDINLGVLRGGERLSGIMPTTPVFLLGLVENIVNGAVELIREGHSLPKSRSRQFCVFATALFEGYTNLRWVEIVNPVIVDNTLLLHLALIRRSSLVQPATSEMLLRDQEGGEIRDIVCPGKLCPDIACKVLRVRQDANHGEDANDTHSGHTRCQQKRRSRLRHALHSDE